MKAVRLVILILIYVAWIHFEHKFVNPKLENITVFHIKELQKTYKDSKLMNDFMDIFSALGDKYGVVGCVWFSFHFQNNAHSFMTGMLLGVWVLISITLKSL